MFLTMLFFVLFTGRESNLSAGDINLQESNLRRQINTRFVSSYHIVCARGVVELYKKAITSYRNSKDLITPKD